MTTELKRGEPGSITEVMADGFKRAVAFEPGYNDTEPNRYGRHGMQIRFILTGPLGAIQFLIFLSDWTPGTISFGSAPGSLGSMAVDLGHHWSKPTYEGEVRRQCEYLPGGECYYDGSSLAAEKPFRVLVEDGPEAMWALLRKHYEAVAEASR